MGSKVKVHSSLMHAHNGLTYLMVPPPVVIMMTSGGLFGKEGG